MTYRANPLLKKLDRAAELTGMPEFSRQVNRGAALPYRIAPLILLAFSIGGLALQIWVPMSGWVVIMSLWMAGIPLLLAGPMRPVPGGAYDERERALVRSGHFAGLLVVAVLTVGGCFLAGFASAFAMVGHAAAPWTPRLFQDWLGLGFFLLSVESNVAVLFVSWQLPGLMPADDED